MKVDDKEAVSSWQCFT